MLQARPSWTPAQLEQNLKEECSADAGTIQGLSSIQLRTYASLEESDCVASGTEVCENREWSKCGGHGFPGLACCPENHRCEVLDPYYHQCRYHPELETCRNARYHKCGGKEADG